MDNSEKNTFNKLWKTILTRCGIPAPKNNLGDTFNTFEARATALETWRNNRVIAGLLYSAPTTASTQATGAVAPVVRVNRSDGLFVVNGRSLSYTTSVDYMFGGVPVLAVGQSAISARVAYLGRLASDGTTPALGMSAVWGPVATTGQQQPPTDAALRAGIAGVLVDYYVRVATTTVSRTGDLTLTQTYDNTWRDF